MGADLEKALCQMESAPNKVTFSDLLKTCEHFFGEPRTSGTSHWVFKTPWRGNPRVNIQNNKGKAKAYQVRQVLAAIRRLRELENGCE